MNDDFSRILGAYNKARREEFEHATLQFAENSYIYFQAMRAAGFNDVQALELTKMFQQLLLIQATGNKDNQVNE